MCGYFFLILNQCLNGHSCFINNVHAFTVTGLASGWVSETTPRAVPYAGGCDAARRYCRQRIPLYGVRGARGRLGTGRGGRLLSACLQSLPRGGDDLDPQAWIPGR